ncbi:Imm50 family immunity protein [Microvirga sp. 2YAF29]|uniref:Imm50 family immunity protein n=1 Tax=Microvirga sp. 2YAF29 TaxID=3233031 RepID=UPI003F983A72
MPKVELPDSFSSVPGGGELLAWFGYVPNFHDAEVISLHLNRSGASTLKVHIWDVTRDIHDPGQFIHDKDVIVTFTIEEILALDLEGFSHQNVISGLGFRKITPEVASFNMRWLRPLQPQPDIFEITLEPCFGMSGMIQARRVSITLTPGKPEDTIHNA